MSRPTPTRAPERTKRPTPATVASSRRRAWRAGDRPVIEKGQPWERPATGPAQWQVEGDDAALAAAVRDHPGARVGFRPDPTADLARVLGIHTNGGAELELGMDALRITADDRELFAVNMVVVGAPPDRTSWFTRALE